MHRCRWTIDRWRDDEGQPGMSIRCGGPDGCGATAHADGVVAVARLGVWLAEHAAGEGA